MDFKTPGNQGQNNPFRWMLGILMNILLSCIFSIFCEKIMEKNEILAFLLRYDYLLVKVRRKLKEFQVVLTGFLEWYNDRWNLNST